MTSTEPASQPDPCGRGPLVGRCGFVGSTFAAELFRDRVDRDALGHGEMGVGVTAIVGERAEGELLDRHVGCRSVDDELTAVTGALDVVAAATPRRRRRWLGAARRR